MTGRPDSIRWTPPGPGAPARCGPWLAAAAVLVAACSSGPIAPDGQAPVGTNVEHLPAACAGAPTPPSTLDCTGLYSDIVAKQLNPGVEAYTPAVPLWSDGADKDRWIRLPPGTTIDTSKPNEWVFPVGTKLWKQFVKDGRRVETRLWQKVRDGFWVHAVYAWNDDQTAATVSPGGDVPFGSGTYHIPTGDECEKCHRGRTEHILGFGQVELGLPGASGMTLARMVADGRLTPAPPTTSLVIGDDGTGAAAPALGWLHANCGITCHNANSNSTGFGAGMNLSLDPADLDGRSSAAFAPLHTTVGVTVNTPAWNGRVRIIPGDPTRSLLYELISNRGMGKQMPPIATSVVDVQHVALVQTWIGRMTPVDAGAPPTEVADAAPPPPDAAEPDAPEPDGPEPVVVADAGPAGEVDAVSGDAPEPVVVADAGSPGEVDAISADAPEPDAGEEPDAGPPPDAGAGQDDGGTADDGGSGDDGGSDDGDVDGGVVGP